jgi:hypothetical protein
LKEKWKGKYQKSRLVKNGAVALIAKSVTMTA